MVDSRFGKEEGYVNYIMEPSKKIDYNMGVLNNVSPMLFI
jgi:hypothetical protein